LEAALYLQLGEETGVAEIDRRDSDAVLIFSEMDRGRIAAMWLSPHHYITLNGRSNCQSYHQIASHNWIISK
jgi:hypothetical protein